MRGCRYLLVVVPIAALVAAAPALAAQRYTVRWGDTLTGIASAHGVSLHHLARANHMRPNSLLLAGATLRIPGHGHGSSGARRITVQWGDTLSGIADRYGTTITHLAAINGISPFGVLLAGSHLRVPDSAAAPAMAAGGSFDAVRSLDRWAAALRRRSAAGAGRRLDGIRLQHRRRLLGRRLGGDAGDARHLAVHGAADRSPGGTHA